VQSVVTLLLLSKEIARIRFTFDTRLWKEMLRYSLPLLIVGLGGIINETFDRIMLKAWLPGTPEFRTEQVGIYNACYKLSLLITLFVQAFKMGAEPFFFKQAEGENPQKIYARVMKLFVIVLSTMFLVVSLFLPVWARLIGPQYRSSVGIVPILLMANIFLGIYYNLSVWFKVSNRTISGTYITLIGTTVTLAVNYFFIPRFGYMASAWATFFCYGSMMVLSYKWGQKRYPVPVCYKKTGCLPLNCHLPLFHTQGPYLFYSKCHFQFRHGRCVSVGLCMVYSPG
jgi:O-antigen/teichoic acid export membrane protein